MGEPVISTLETVHGRALRAAGGIAVDLMAKHRHPTWEPRRAAGKIAARVNHGRWIVECPQDRCGGAQLASQIDLRFVCVECGAGPYKVVWPKTRAAIEEALEPRPEANRNWHPGETVKDLHAENAGHL